ncbi:MAG: hypothetical protein PHW04_17155, partial [Candidatus Wallbacteria bacterium]|nr:hypothetical protein [Candidatus Wallbacteria bacterium]
MKKRLLLFLLLAIFTVAFAAQPTDPGEIGDIILRDGMAGSLFGVSNPWNYDGVGHDAIYIGYYWPGIISSPRIFNNEANKADGIIVESMSNFEPHAIRSKTIRPGETDLTLRYFKSIPDPHGYNTTYRGSNMSTYFLAPSIRMKICDYAVKKSLNYPTYYWLFSIRPLEKPVRYVDENLFDEYGNRVDPYPDNDFLGDSGWGEGNYVNKLGEDGSYHFGLDSDQSLKSLNVFSCAWLVEFAYKKAFGYGAALDGGNCSSITNAIGGWTKGMLHPWEHWECKANNNGTNYRVTESAADQPTIGIKRKDKLISKDDYVSFDKDTVFTLVAKDGDQGSGIGRIDLFIENKQLKLKYDVGVVESSVNFKIDTSNYPNDQTTFKVEAVAYDLAGNKSERLISFFMCGTRVDVGFCPPDLQDGKAPDAQWSLDGGITWKNAGTEFLKPGDYTLTFRDVPNYKTPPEKQITVLDNPDKVQTYIVEYVPYYKLFVNIYPETAVVAGAQWTFNYLNPKLGAKSKSSAIQKSGTWLPMYYNSGEYVLVEKDALFTIGFKTIQGWQKPDDITITWPINSDTTFNVSYMPGRLLTVKIEPEEARTQGAYWLLNDQIYQRLSDSSVMLAPGTLYTITFGINWDRKDYWKIPEPIHGVMESEDITETGTYEKIFHKLTVLLGPPEAVAAGAAFKVQDLSEQWETANKTFTLPHGSEEIINCKKVTGWSSPWENYSLPQISYSKKITLLQDTTVECTYSMNMCGVQLSYYTGGASRQPWIVQSWKVVAGIWSTDWIPESWWWNRCVYMPEGTEYTIYIQYSPGYENYNCPNSISGVAQYPNSVEYVCCLPPARWKDMGELPFKDYSIIDKNSWTVVTPDKVYKFMETVNDETVNNWVQIGDNYSFPGDKVYFYDGQPYFIGEDGRGRDNHWNNSFHFGNVCEGVSRYFKSPSYGPQWYDCWGTASDFYLHTYAGNPYIEDTSLNKWGLVHTTDFVNFNYIGPSMAQSGWEWWQGIFPSDWDIFCRYNLTSSCNGHYNWYKYQLGSAQPWEKLFESVLVYVGTFPAYTNYFTGQRCLMTCNDLFEITCYEATQYFGLNDTVEGIRQVNDWNDISRRHYPAAWNAYYGDNPSCYTITRNIDKIAMITKPCVDHAYSNLYLLDKSNPIYPKTQVIIKPESAVVGGGQWRLQDEPRWRDSESYSMAFPDESWVWIEFKPIFGWNTPPSQYVCITDTMTPVIGTYTQQNQFCVFLDPPDARWQFTTDPPDLWRESGCIQLGSDNMPCTKIMYLRFKEMPGYITPPNQAVDLDSSSNEVHLSIQYVPRKTFTVHIDSQDAISCGARWKVVNETGDLISDQTIEAQIGHVFRIALTDLATIDSSWKNPNPLYFDYPINSDTPINSTVCVTYKSVSGTLEVRIKPDNIASVGQWRLDSESIWRNSGVEVPVRKSSYYGVVFKDIEGRTTPPSIYGKMDDNKVLYGVYQGMHTLTVNLAPQGAVGGGAKWKLADGYIWRNSGSMIELQEGATYEIAFGDASGCYTKPANIYGTMGKSDEIVTCNYLTRDTAQFRLQVSITPEVALSAGAAWCLSKDTEEWRFSGDSAMLDENSTYEIIFKDILGWTCSMNLSGTITSDISSEAMFSPVFRNLLVNMTPNEATLAGAQWKLSGDADWKNSGTILELQESSDYHILFKAIPGWNTPQTIEGFIWTDTYEANGHYSLLG